MNESGEAVQDECQKRRYDNSKEHTQRRQVIESHDGKEGRSGEDTGERQSERASRPSDKWWYKLLVPVSGFAALVVGFAILNQPPVQPGVEGEGPAPTMPVASPELETPQDVAAQASTYEFYAEDQKMSVIWVTTDEAAEFESPTRDPLLENE